MLGRSTIAAPLPGSSKDKGGRESKQFGDNAQLPVRTGSDLLSSQTRCQRAIVMSRQTELTHRSLVRSLLRPGGFCLVGRAAQVSKQHEATARLRDIDHFRSPNRFASLNNVSH